MKRNYCPFCGEELEPGEKCDCIDIGLPECNNINLTKKVTLGENSTGDDHGKKKGL